MNRREFITLLGGAAATWPLVAQAQQQAAMPVVGYLSSGSSAGFTRPMAAFRQGLNEAGYVDGQNINIQYRWAEGQYDRLPALAADLVRRQVAVLGAFGGVHTVLAAKAATATIPIVFSMGSDPVEFGLVASLNKPGSNVTGVSHFAAELESKRLGLLRELVPQVTAIAVLINPTNGNAENQSREVIEAARALGVRLHILNASKEGDFTAAFASLVQMRAGALAVAADPFFFGQREQLVALAARHAIPTIYEWREFAEVGGLLSYGTSLTDANRQSGIYAGRILKGEKPADLPVVRSTKFELIVNVKTAKALDLTIPNSMQLLADEVIE
jgi:putative tryptophan/tyrosine transport system substrate-binding protein